MPELSRFYGVIIKRYYRDHLPPYFHAEYGEYELVVGIMPIVVREGAAPARVRSMVLEWAAVHRQALLADWQRCEGGLEPEAIPSLE
jgi:hypothetical protein